MRRSTALTFQMIKTSNRAAALRALGLGTLGAGVLGGGALAYNQLGGPSSLSDLNFEYFGGGRPGNPSAFADPIMLNAANPFSSMNNVRNRVQDAIKYGRGVEALTLYPEGLPELPRYAPDPKLGDDMSTYAKIRFMNANRPVDPSPFDRTLARMMGARAMAESALGQGYFRGTPELGYDRGRPAGNPIVAFE